MSSNTSLLQISQKRSGVYVLPEESNGEQSGALPTPTKVYRRSIQSYEIETTSDVPDKHEYQRSLPPSPKKLKVPTPSQLPGPLPSVPYASYPSSIDQLSVLDSSSDSLSFKKPSKVTTRKTGVVSRIALSIKPHHHFGNDTPSNLQSPLPSLSMQSVSRTSFPMQIGLPKPVFFFVGSAPNPLGELGEEDPSSPKTPPPPNDSTSLSTPDTPFRPTHKTITSPFVIAALAIHESFTITRETDSYSLIAVYGKRGQHSQIYRAHGDSQLVPGISNERIYVKVFQKMRS